MSVKCPSCGFDSAEGAQWCDMCKQPFNKAKPAPAAAKKEPLEKADDLLQKLAVEEKEKVPPVPPWARLAAWAFLGVWIIFGFILMGVYMARYEDARGRAPVSDNAAD